MDLFQMFKSKQIGNQSGTPIQEVCYRVLESWGPLTKFWNSLENCIFLKLIRFYIFMRLLCHQYQVMAFKEGERLEKEALLRLQQVNLNKPGVEKGASGDQNGIKTERKRSDSMETDMPHSSDNTLLQNGGSTPSLTSSQSVCVCSGQPRPLLHRCHLCKDWFHGGCVPFPSLLGSSDTNLTKPLCWWDWNTRFLCPRCQRSRRPRLEIILALLVALQKLPVRLPEGEALQCLTERAINWQGRAKQALDTLEVQRALERLQQVEQEMNSIKEEEPEEKTNGMEIL